MNAQKMARPLFATKKYQLFPSFLTKSAILAGNPLWAHVHEIFPCRHFLKHSSTFLWLQMSSLILFSQTQEGPIIMLHVSEDEKLFLARNQVHHIDTFLLHF